MPSNFKVRYSKFVAEIRKKNPNAQYINYLSWETQFHEIYSYGKSSYSLMQWCKHQGRKFEKQH